MNTENSYTVNYQPTKPMINRIANSLIFGSFLGFFIYISRGSTFWTFLTGSMMLVFLSSWVFSLTNTAKNTFTKKIELKKWVDGLPDE